jgi:putative N6-adenine-specific DNA methylase
MEPACSEDLFAVTAPGLATYAAQELRQLGLLPDIPSAHRSRLDEAGVAFAGDLPAIYRANLHLRTASRVLLRLGEFYAAAFSELRKKAARLPWEAYLRPDQPVRMHVTCHKSRLYHSDAVAERIAGAIGDRLGQKPGKPAPLRSGGAEEEGGAGQLVVARLVHDRCTISIDTSGDLLHRRGYRLAAAKAPLRETLAAAVLLASGWDRAAPLLDPFCGSGTIPIEAALMGGNIAPGKARRFAFMDWPGFDSAAWQAVLAEALAAETPLVERCILASDRDAGAVEMAQANAARAGVALSIQFICQAVSAIQPAGVGWVVTNPPYGLRVSRGKDLRNLYAQFGNVLRAQCPGWRAAILCSDPGLLRQTGLKLESCLSLVNGGVAVRLACGQIPSHQKP